MCTASKAFHRVHYGTLFRLLRKQEMLKCIIRLILDSYTRQTSCALWNNENQDILLWPME